jgi:hypothetical protein
MSLSASVCCEKLTVRTSGKLTCVCFLQCSLNISFNSVVITIEQKLEAVRRIKNGEILRNVAANFDVGISMVSDWVKSKSKHEEHSN